MKKRIIGKNSQDNMKKKCTFQSICHSTHCQQKLEARKWASQRDCRKGKNLEILAGKEKIEMFLVISQCLLFYVNFPVVMVLRKSEDSIC